MTKFESIQIGDVAELKHVITQKDIDAFVDLTGDDNKLHTDREFARKTVFKKNVAHGMLGASFLSTVIGTKLPGDGSLWFSQSFDFLLPVRIGDEISIRAEVVKKIERDSIIELKTDIYNQHRQLVTTGSAKVKVIEQSVPDSVDKGDQKKKVALVIGATGGIGRAACFELARMGFDVIVHYHRNREQALWIQSQLAQFGQEARIVSGDITDDRQMHDMFEEIARHYDAITALVNCTTHSIADIKWSSLSWNDILSHIEINVRGSFNLIRSVLPFMEERKYGKIVFLTTQAIETPNAGWTHYITAKSALNGFSKSMAMELASKGVRINMVSPGMTDTELIADIPQRARLLNEARTPLKRLATPQDVASAIGYLASEHSDFLTGETIRVNGGQVML